MQSFKVLMMTWRLIQEDNFLSAKVLGRTNAKVHLLCNPCVDFKTPEEQLLLILPGNLTKKICNSYPVCGQCSMWNS